jgi:hypothetical protein
VIHGDLLKQMIAHDHRALDRLASLLITDDENTHVIQVRMGGLVKLVPKSEDFGFTLA